MILSFKHKGLREFFTTGSLKGIKPNHAKRLRLLLAHLNVVNNINEITLPGLRLPPLRGNLKGFYAIDVNGNWRIIFKFEGENIIDVNYLDYH